MAASLPRTQLPSNNNAVYEKYFHQLESGSSGKVLSSDAAFFLKRSGLADLVLGKIWDLADTDCKGHLNKQEFFVALQLVACAQNGMEVCLSSLKAVVPPPRFDAGSPPLFGTAVTTDIPWAVKPDEKAKYDAIFDSLNPVNGFLSGDKVKPVLLNSKLSVEILGRVWELSDIDHDGLLDRDEFAVAMFLVYSALEKEPVPMSLPHTLVPQSKRKVSISSASLPVIPTLPMPPSKESRQSLPPVGILPTKVQVTQWVVSHAEKTKCDELFHKLDKDMDGLVSGLEVREIFLKTGLPSVLLAHIWTLCDTKDCGKLSKEQFALAFHFINQKIVKGVDPPRVLTPEMMPPSERNAATKVPTASSPVADFSAIKELDSLNNEIVELQREKTSVEQELSEKEDAVKCRTGEVQDLQDEVERETINLQNLKSQKQEVQEILAELDEQKAKLESQLQELRLKCAEETQMIASLKVEITTQETQISNYEDELSKAKSELNRLQEETILLEENLETGKQRLAPLEQQLQESKLEICSVQAKLEELKASENNVEQLNWCHHLVNGIGDHSSLSNSSSEPTNLHENTGCDSPGQLDHQSRSSPVRSSPEINQTSGSDGEEKDDNVNALVPQKEVSFQVDPYDVNPVAPPSAPVQDPGLDFFQSDPFVGSDPFKDDPFGKIDPFGGDPFKDSDPFASDVFFKQASADPFASSKVDSSKEDLFSKSKADSFTSSNADPFVSSKAESLTSSKADPFQPSSADPFKSSEQDPFTSAKVDPFLATESTFSSEDTLKNNDPFAPGGTVVSAVSESGSEDPFASFFGSESIGTGFADFSLLSKTSTDTFDATLPIKDKESLNKAIFEDDPTQKEEVPPALPPKTGTPTRPCPLPPGKRPSSRTAESSNLFRQGDPFQHFSQSFYKETLSDPFDVNKATSESDNFSTYQSEDDMIEWAKRESEKEEEERLARLKQQEQEDLELAIALSKSEISEA
ncbi:epidermal growth factor receptor substrate 15 [Xenopus tropicalis]|uniref:Epidermal growth factor receptor substrate 15 n=1 Tax=Xenopus tropicalis TaxID=8364 RepID=A0A8J0Q9H0_XENTR|nr:epidermal growth factor receptor substrate 15 [Xenopus tropicalis]|eukprot:NP_001120100.2 epidermal growth factor receptor substrate 15 [Xenopus tropicalis]